ncbi:MAG: hypothetical protein IJ404_03105 [Clostridia bacterium]|nr:hypothetical protein [Clostridia bacterium]
MPIEENKKHAYLIMAHNKFDQLAVLVDLLDDERNDIYLHIDKKAKDFDRSSIKTKNAGLFYVKPMSVIWGGDSMIKCELRLFESAGEKHYAYYHLLSGIDLPIKTQDYIHSFFKEHTGKNFINLDQKALSNREFTRRVDWRHLFQNIIGRSYDPFMCRLRGLQERLISLQMKLGMKRKEIIPLYKGANWISVTDEMIQYVLTQKKLIKKQFYCSHCADEVFLQSVAMASPYRDTVTGRCLREIDWTRGGPYTFRSEDVPMLLRSENLYARKFDIDLDRKAMELIAEQVKK